jgi:hypothetical protein
VREGSVYKEPAYPVVKFMLTYGKIVSALVALVPVAAALVLTWPVVSPAMMVGGIVVGAIFGLLMLSYVEVLRIISDTLLPR